MEDRKIPKHVAIILDGNGRWAKKRGKNRSYGHLQGFNNLKKLARYIFDCGVEVLSVYAFSTENFKRSEDEVSFLMNLFIDKFKELNDLENVKIIFSGKKTSPLPEKVIKVMEELEEKSADNTAHIFNICINYDGKHEIVDACKKICNEALDSVLNIDELDTNNFSKYLYNDLPPIDFLIRTSGELRVSSFMLYQLAYAEFYFPNIYFPDFNNEEFDKAIEIYNKRDRRFGNVSKK